MIGRTAKKGTNRTSQFSSFVLNQVEFKLGEVVQLKEYSDNQCFATILKILKKAREVYIRIRWYYKPSDIFGPKNTFFSKGELFDSDLEQEVSIQCVYGKAQVLSLQDYHSHKELNSDTFFCRATYLTATNSITPSLESWPRVCVCSSILNPDELLIQCESCWELFHPRCVKASTTTQSWFCPRCLSN